MPKKVLLTHRYFWPDSAPYARMLRSIGVALADAGYEVNIFASHPSYRPGGSQSPNRERLGMLSVQRVRVLPERRAFPILRLLNAFIYCAALLVHILRKRPELVTASTFPPVLAGWTASLAAKLTGARFIYHMQDIHPEVSEYSKGGLGGALPAYILRFLDNQTLRRADAIIVLSEDMAATLARRGFVNLPVHVINNFLLDDFGTFQTSPPAHLLKRRSRRRIIFAGNLGRFQRLPLLIEGIARCFDRHPNLEVLFLGDGEMEGHLKAQWQNHPQVIFGPFLPFDQARALIAEAEVGLVSLMPNMYRVAYPSKVLTYLGLGVPILALVEPQSELARTVVSNGLGAVPVAPTPEAIEQALEACLNNSDQTERIRSWHEHNGRPEVVLERWCQIVSGIT